MNPAPSLTSENPRARQSTNPTPGFMFREAPTDPRPPRRKKANADPLFRPKKPSQFPPKTLVRPAGGLTNGHLAPLNQPSRPATPTSQRSVSPAKSATSYDERVSGFSDPRVTASGIPYKDYKVVVTKRDLLEGLRFHLAQLPADKPIDIRNEADFTKPVRLHRRDPRSAAAAPAKEETEDHKDGLDEKQREDLNQRKEARQREREANLAQIAPSAGSSRKVNNFKKKSQQVYRPDYTIEEKRRIQMNYEEKLPWHLEDFDNKHCFVGKNQIGSARVHAALVNEVSADGSTSRFRLLPVEKIYQFKPKRDIIVPMSIDEAERAMKKGGFLPESLLRKEEARKAQRILEGQLKKDNTFFSGAQAKAIAGREGEEADLDFDDDFADDEEGDLFADKDEDEKLAEKKIKEDQLQANFLDFKDEKDVDKAELEEKQEALARKENFKALRKALERRERNFNHGSDSDSFGSSSDSEEERERLEKERLANLTKDQLDEKKSGLSSSGNNTPSSRKEKAPGGGMLSDREGGIKKSSSSKSLKRPGSPNLSDASGTDASVRKKKLKHRHLSSTQPTPQPSRPISPANVPSSSAPNQAKKNRKTLSPGSAAGSDTEAAAYSDAAMSDGSGVSKSKRLKLTISNTPGARSPKTTTPQPEVPPQTRSLPTVDEIRTKIPSGGISVKDLLHSFGGALPKERHPEFIQLVKIVARLDKETKLMVLK